MQYIERLVVRTAEIKGHIVLGGIENFQVYRLWRYDEKEDRKFMWFLD